MVTGKSIRFDFRGKTVTVLNQRSRLWTHPYDYRTPQKATLSSAGCGVFSMCHCGQWLTGREFSAEELADFSMANGGRGDDGTDRPALLAAMMEKGWAQKFGFRYEMDGLRNDINELWHHLYAHRGVALCNLRVGHIVSLLDARVSEDERQVLVLDSYSETMEPRVAGVVREVIADSAITSANHNEKGIYIGTQIQYAMYWAACDTIRDFNLLHAL
ncbi:MAG: hypothetical protein IJ214_07610 [Clostridia bacterium]|nr:hypothetical protein [Clostridia bacterium]